MRERGSNTARQPRKGGGGLPIGACLADFGASIGRDWSRFGRDLACLRASIVSQSVVIGRAGRVDWSRFGVLARVDCVAIWRFVAIRRADGRNRSRFGRAERRADTQAEDKTQKSPIALIGQSGCLASLCVARL